MRTFITTTCLRLAQGRRRRDFAVRSLPLAAAFAFSLAWLGPTVTAEAAKLRIINCTETRVKICTTEEKDTEILAPDVIKRISCGARCQLKILECKGQKCGDCEDEEGVRLEGDWGKGDYRLVALARTHGSSGRYLKSDLEDGRSCPLPYTPQVR
jgi:hypothetical protein